MPEAIESAAPAEAQAEQVTEQVELTSTEATAEQAQAAAEEALEEKAKKEPWFQKRIGELTREKYENKRQSDVHAQENAQLRDQLARAQQGEQVEANPNDFQANVRKEAQRLNAEKSFNDTCNKVYAAGKAEFKDFDQSVQNLQTVGVSRDFLELVTTSDAGAKLISHLGNDMDEAARIAAMTPVQMARELTRLEYKLGQVASPNVSKAPPPINPVGSGNAVNTTLANASMDDYAAMRAKQGARWAR